MADNIDILEVSVRLKSGAFESSISIPLDRPVNEINEFTLAWLELMRTGLKIAQARTGEKKVGTDPV